MSWKATLRIGLVCAGATSVRAADRFELVWPTPNTAWSQGKPSSQWLQHAGNGDPASGCFGGVRSGGTHFHEGIDIRPAARDRRGEPLDNVLAAMPGVVRYINSTAGDSSYGRYVVVEHPSMTPAVHTLYAHLSAIDVKPDSKVKRGQTIGRSGQTGLAGGDHLHFTTLLQGIPVNPVEWWDPHWIHDRIEAKLAPYR